MNFDDIWMVIDKLYGSVRSAAGNNTILHVALIEYLLQQLSWLTRGTPTVTKIVVSAVMLKCGYSIKTPKELDLINADESCFKAFTSSFNQYLEVWRRNSPFKL
ncbi:MAG TPA: hypothetical protein EYN38_00250 [Flavobacteriales bacterium]|nr:hypothetical protein [Flavobacteriales bacterium]